MIELGLVEPEPEVCELPTFEPIVSDISDAFCDLKNDGCGHGLTLHSRGLIIHDRCLHVGCRCKLAVLTSKAKQRVKREIIA